MRDIIKYIYNKADPTQSFFDKEGLIFSIGQFYISISFDMDDNEDREFESIKDIEVVANEFESANIRRFKIGLIEVLNDRKDCIWQDEDDKKYYYSFLPVSIRNAIMEIVHLLNSESKGLVDSYSFDVYDPSAGYCNDDGNYAGYIFIHPELVTIESLDYLIGKLLPYQPIRIPCNYCLTFIQPQTPKNVFRAQFVNTNTKVRRLGYLKSFFSFINEKQKVPEAFLKRRFEEYALKYNDQLSGALNDKGVIISANGKSAEPYITLLKEFNLITLVNRVVVATKWLRTYVAMRNPTDQFNENIFVLDKLDKMFFLETLLRTDFLYTSILLELIYSEGTTSYAKIVGIFQQKLLAKLKSLQSDNYFRNEKAFAEIRTIEKRVSEWKNAKSYLEHIIMPRLNWLLDLELINISELNIVMTDAGKRLLIELNFWSDVMCADIGNSIEFLERYYPLVFAMTYDNTYGINVERDEIIEAVKKNVEESFRLFKTLAPNRVTSSQAITFSKYKLYLENQYTVSAKTHERILETELKNTFVYKYQPRYEDGYIQKIIN